MIDLHSHILPGIDDGASNMVEAIEMARMAVSGGTTVLACTPHIRSPIYSNSASTIGPAVEELQLQLNKADIPLELVVGADIHMAADMLTGLETKELPTLNGSRYFLFEPPHSIMPPGIAKFCASILEKRFVPVLTHPERLSWIERSYDVICELDRIGVAIQLTAGSITGHFGERIQKWSARMLDEDRVDIVASDAHDLKHRTTSLDEVRSWLTDRYGRERAMLLLHDNPTRILKDQALCEREGATNTVAPQKSGMMRYIKRLAGG